MGDFWVFGYGSLMWKPGFAHTRAHRARLSGYRRALCIRSFVHRGTPERPGLVLGLDRGGSCLGLAFQVPSEQADETLDYLRARELVTNVYLERRLPIRLDTGAVVEAVTFVVDRAHEQYAGRIGVDDAVGAVLGATGVSGANEDYVFNTVEHLQTLGIRDRWLEGVAERVRTGLAEARPQALSDD